MLLVLGVGLFFRVKWLKVASILTFAICYLAALVYGLIAVSYYEASKTIAGIELFQTINGQEGNILWQYFLEYWFLILVALVIISVATWLFSKLSLVINGGYRFIYVLFFLGISVFLGRGGIALKPLNLLDAYAALSSGEATTAVTPMYVLIESYGKKTLVYEEYVSDTKLVDELQRDNHVLFSPLSFRPNICLIMLESFGEEYTGGNKMKGESYTPFLDSLREKGIYYPNAYANGLRSMDAITSVYLGIPSFMKGPFIGSLYTNGSAQALPSLLADQGYYSSFYHAADELSMGFKPFLLSYGLDQYFGKQQYPDQQDFDGTWGIFDEPYLGYVQRKLGKQASPWFSGVFTLSSHHPYKVPAHYSELVSGTLPIHKSVRYTDRALRGFFEKSQEQPWFDSTVFIICADHSSTNENAEYKTYTGKYEIPMILYAPALLAPRVDTRVVQQIDLYPTVSHLAGVSSVTAFGKSLIDTTAGYVYLFDGNIYSVVSDSFTLEWGGSGVPKLFAIADATNKKNIRSKYPQQSKEMLHKLRLFIQKYKYRLVNDNFE